MGKRGSWFSAIKRVFLPHSKEKLGNDPEKKSSKDKKKKGLGKLKHAETNSFIPLFREPSSVEKIFGDFEREQQKLTFRPPTPPEQPTTPPFVLPRVASPRAPAPRVASPRVASPRVTSPRAASPRAASPRIFHHQKEISYRPEPTLRNHHASATKIQAAYRGYMARRSFRALKGLVRLQGVVRGQNVKRQTVNAMKYMQLLVRVQSQIQSRRIQMLENQARRQAQFRNDKEVDSTFGKWSQASEAGNNDDWDDSLITKEEREVRLQRKVEAVIKRERAMAYAYSHQLWKASPKSTQTPLADIRSGGFPWWWNWLERQLPSASNPPESQIMKSFQLTPPRAVSEMKPSPSPWPQSSNHKQHPFGFDIMDTPTPKSTKSAIITTSKNTRTPPPNRTPLANSTSLSKYSRPRASGANSPFDMPLKDDDSLMSCPPFSVPNYMNPTVSAKAKARANSNPRERFPGTPSSSDSKRRLSFPLTQGIGSFKWNKGSLFSNKDSSSQRMLDKNQSLQSVGDLSVDSTVSLPAGIGRKPFNRFV
ncbi:protein IQ-DOMAIN 14-like [Fagus crenata]